MVEDRLGEPHVVVPGRRRHFGMPEELAVVRRGHLNATLSLAQDDVEVLVDGGAEDRTPEAFVVDRQVCATTKEADANGSPGDQHLSILARPPSRPPGP